MHWFYLGATWLDVVAMSFAIGILTCAIGVVPHHEIRPHQRL